MATTLSIIIPTKDRYQYLIPVVRYFSRFSGLYSFEIIIEDNSPCNNKWIEANSEHAFLPEVRYFHTPHSRDIVANFDAAFKRVSGDYCILLGDDDFVTEDIFKSLDFCQNHEIDSICFPLCWFHWPDLIKHKPELPSLSISNISPRKVIKIDASEQMIKIVESQRYNLEYIAKVYHGIIRTEIMHDCFKKYGTYFPGYSPDIGNASALCYEVKKHYFMPIYAVVAGFGGKSAGGLGAQKRHVGKIDDIKYLPKGILTDWPKKIPYFWTGSTIWAASILYVSKKTPDDELTKKFSFSRLYGYMLIAHPKILFNWLLTRNISDYFQSCIGLFRIIADKAFSSSKSNSKMVSVNVKGPSLEDASSALEAKNSSRLSSLSGDFL